MTAFSKIRQTSLDWVTYPVYRMPMTPGLVRGALSA